MLFGTAYTFASAERLRTAAEAGGRLYDVAVITRHCVKADSLKRWLGDSANHGKALPKDLLCRNKRDTCDGDHYRITRKRLPERVSARSLSAEDAWERS